MRALVASVASACVVAGCALLPNVDDSAPTLTQVSDPRGTTFLFGPWPYDAATAFLCLDEPGEPFTAGLPPEAAAGCVPLMLSQDGRGIRARFDVDLLPDQLRDAFGTSGAPWYFAVRGSRGSSSETLVTEILVSPIPSDAGPS